MTTLKKKVTLRKKQQNVEITNVNKPKRKIVTVLCIVACAIVACVIWRAIRGDDPNAASEKQIAETTQTVQENAPSTLESENVGESTENNSQTTEIDDNTTTAVSVPASDNPENVQLTEPILAGNTEPDISGNETPVVETPTVQTAPVAESTPEINTSNNSNSAKLSEEYVEEMVLKVIRGNYGNGQERKDKLGDEYNDIQSKVNEYYRNNGLL